MRPSALVERYRMALEVIANGAEWEPGTKTAKIALSDPWVSREVIAIRDDIEEAERRLSVREAVEVAREAEPTEPASELEEAPEVQPELDDEPEPVDLAELDREMDEELAEAAEEPHQDMPGTLGLSALALAILATVREADITSTDLKARFAFANDSTRKYATQRLMERGLIVAEGEARWRIYRAVTVEEVSQDKPTMPDPEPAPSKVEGAGTEDGYTLAGVAEDQRAARVNGVGSDEGRVLDSVGFHPDWSIAQHARRLDLHQDRVAQAMRKLERESEVKSDVKANRVVWSVR